MTQRIAAAGGLVLDPAGRLLLVQRLREPGAGLWSVPGGKCEPGESSAAACVREVREETGLSVQISRFAGAVERPGPDGVVFAIDDFVCSLDAASGPVRAASDAAAARFVTAAELGELDRAGALVPGLLEALTGWGVLPR